MFRNKHIIAALIVTPILALAGYFATDYLVSERPQQARSGVDYPLVQLPNCRYASGQCTLKNGDFKMTITGSIVGGVLSLHFSSVLPLQSAFVSVSHSEDVSKQPIAMTSISLEKNRWQAILTEEVLEHHRLRLVVSAAGTRYYAETALPFLEYRTSFNKDFRNL